MPGVGYSFHQIFTGEARWMVAQIDIKVLDLFPRQIQQIWGTIEKPPSWYTPTTMSMSGSDWIWPRLNAGYSPLPVQFRAVGIGLSSDRSSSVRTCFVAQATSLGGGEL